MSLPKGLGVWSGGKVLVGGWGGGGLVGGQVAGSDILNLILFF